MLEFIGFVAVMGGVFWLGKKYQKYKTKVRRRIIDQLTKEEEGHGRREDHREGQGTNH